MLAIAGAVYLPRRIERPSSATPPAVELRTRPAQVDVFADGAWIGLSDAAGRFRWPRAPAGAVINQVQFRCVGYEPLSLPFESLKPSEENLVELKPRFVELDARSEPPGAAVWLAGQPIGMTPLTTRIGGEQIRAARALIVKIGFEKTEAPLEFVEEGKRLRCFVRLNRHANDSAGTSPTPARPEENSPVASARPPEIESQPAPLPGRSILIACAAGLDPRQVPSARAAMFRAIDGLTPEQMFGLVVETPAGIVDPLGGYAPATPERRVRARDWIASAVRAAPAADPAALSRLIRDSLVETVWLMCREGWNGWSDPDRSAADGVVTSGRDSKLTILLNHPAAPGLDMSHRRALARDAGELRQAMHHQGLEPRTR